MNHNYDFIAIGDVVTDAFIRLKDPSAHIDIDHGRREICMRFAEKIPYEEVYVVPAVGNSPNAAVAAAKLGLKSALVSNLGDDYFGKECLNALRQAGVATDFIRTHKGVKTNYHYVLWYLDDRTILIKHEEYPYILPEINSPKWLYLSSLGGHSLDFHSMIESYLESHPDVKMAFQPGTFQMKLGREKLEYFYKRSNVFLCNREEAQRILGTAEEEIKNLMTLLHRIGPKIIVVTDGPKGAYTYDGNEMWFMPPYPDPKPPYERTGAGDAFSSTFVAAVALGLDIPTALKWAPINSMSVVQKVGAQAGLLTRPQLEKYLEEASQEYQPKKI